NDSLEAVPRSPTKPELEELVNALRASLLPPTTPQSAPMATMAMPASYTGDAAECGGFLLQVALFIEMQPQKFSTERTKVAFLISLLNGRALLWYILLRIYFNLRRFGRLGKPRADAEYT
uniref:DUF4939 domain-containing protein n=1 Tax=Sinocyclocheilus anshuiensis TaxID=1608454 RepID=A0A671M689_9TELE